MELRLPRGPGQLVPVLGSSAGHRPLVQTVHALYVLRSSLMPLALRCSCNLQVRGTCSLEVIFRTSGMSCVFGYEDRGKAGATLTR